MKAKTASNAILYGEAGQDLVEFVALTDSGDQTIFNSADALWSDASGKVPNIKPDGIKTAAPVTVADSGSNDVVDVPLIICYLAGVETTVAAGADTSCPRGDTSYLLLTLAASGYTACVAGDIGQTVTGGITGDTGVLVGYNNTTREWLVDPTAAEDTFDDDDEALTIVTGTGAGDLSAIGASPTYKICCVTVNSSGALAVVEGHEGTSFSTTRGVPGGPPFIPVGSICRSEIRYTSTTPAPVTDAEIKQIDGTHSEWYNNPLWDEKFSRNTDGAAGYAGVTFYSALDAIHTGGIPKAVYAEYYTPTFAEIQLVSDFVAPENAYSVSSETVYGSTIGTESETLGAGSFKARLQNGINDAVLLMKGDTRWLKFYPDRLVTTKWTQCQGKLGIKRTYPSSGSMVADVSIAAGVATEDNYS